mgnify:CR=1 FL=1
MTELRAGEDGAVVVRLTTTLAGDVAGVKGDAGADRSVVIQNKESVSAAYAPMKR